MAYLEKIYEGDFLKPVMELELSVRSLNCLVNAGIKTVGELIQKKENDLLATKNFGRKSLNEIKEVLGDMGLRLGMEPNNDIETNRSMENLYKTKEEIEMEERQVESFLNSGIVTVPSNVEMENRFLDEAEKSPYLFNLLFVKTGIFEAPLKGKLTSSHFYSERNRERFDALLSKMDNGSCIELTEIIRTAEKREKIQTDWKKIMAIYGEITKLSKEE